MLEVITGLASHTISGGVLRYKDGKVMAESPMTGLVGLALQVCCCSGAKKPDQVCYSRKKPVTLLWSPVQSEDIRQFDYSSK